MVVAGARRAPSLGPCYHKRRSLSALHPRSAQTAAKRVLNLSKSRRNRGCLRQAQATPASDRCLSLSEAAFFAQITSPNGSMYQPAGQVPNLAYTCANMALSQPFRPCMRAGRPRSQVALAHGLQSRFSALTPCPAPQGERGDSATVCVQLPLSRLRERGLGGEGWRGNRTLQPPWALAPLVRHGPCIMLHSPHTPYDEKGYFRG